MKNNYFLDCEFVEGTQKSMFGKTKPTIDLISIGIVDEKGRDYYAVSKEFNVKEAWYRKDVSPTGTQYWLRENVLWPIYWDLCAMDDPMQAHGLYSMRNSRMGYLEFCSLLKKHGKTHKNIAKDIIGFCMPDTETWTTNKVGSPELVIIKDYPEFYGYYSDYDWVVFCWLFGRMMDLPAGFPMYCKDLQQTLDETAAGLMNNINNASRDSRNLISHAECLKRIKNHPAYPKNEYEHNVLDDAKWNLALFNFLNFYNTK